MKSSLKQVQIVTRRGASSKLNIALQPLRLTHIATLRSQGTPFDSLYLQTSRRRCLSSLKSDDSYTDLKKWSQQWLEDTHKARWTEEDVSVAQYVLQKWVDDCPGNDQLAATKWAIRILRRWLQCEQRFRVDSRHMESVLLVENLHRLLHILGQLEETSTRNDPEHSRDSSTVCRQLSVDLIHLFSEAADHLQEPILRPGNKAITMVLNTIAKRPDVRGSVELARDLVETHRKHGHEPADLTTNSTYLHVLACCSPYYNESPKIAEQSLIEMESPDAKCYGSIIRAWAGISEVDATKRAQFWFDRCLKEDVFDNKTATIAFNIVLSAWGRLDHAERAEIFLHDVTRLCREGSFAFRGPDNLSFLMVLNAWNRSKRESAPERVSKLLATMKALCDNHRFQLSNPSIDVYNVVLETWAKQRNSGPRVESMVQQLEQDYGRSGETNQRPSLKSYIASIRAWANTASDDAIPRAHAIVKKLERFGVDELIPDTMVYTTLMQVWAKSNREDAVDKVLALLNKMHRFARTGKRQVIPSVVTYNVVLHTLVKYHDLDVATELLLEMVDNPNQFVPRPDTISYTTVLHGLQHTTNPSTVTLALEILDKMEEQMDGGDGESVCPNSVYEAAVNVLIKHPGTGRPEEAESILWRLRKRFEIGMCLLGPDYRLCNAVLKCWVRSKEGFAPERAEALFQWMQRTSNTENNAALSPNVETINTMIQVWAVSKRKGAWYRVKELYESMKRNELNPGLFDYSQVLVALRNSDVEDKLLIASEIFADILLTSKTQTNFSPNNQTFHVLCDICESHATHNKAESRNFLQDMTRVILTEDFQVSSPVKARLSEILKLLDIEDGF